MYFKIIEEALKEKGISWAELVQGVCTEENIKQYYLEGEMDRAVLNVFLQRLGISTGLFSTYLSAEEYPYYSWRMKILRMANRMDWKRTKELLYSSIELLSKSSRVLQEQFELIMSGIVVAETDQNMERAEALMERALCLTRPNIVENLEGTLLLMSGQEWCALLNLMVIRYKEGDSEVKIILQKILRRLELHPLQESEQGKVYSFVAVFLAQIYIEEKSFYKCKEICEKAIELLVKGSALEQMSLLLKFAAESRKAIGENEDAENFAKQYEALKEIYYNCPVKSQKKWLLTPMMEVGEEIGIYGKLIAQKRQEKGKTRNQICEGICSEKTLMRIESGNTRARSYIVRDLLKRLDLPDISMVSDIVTSDIEVFEIYRKLNKMMAFRDKLGFSEYLEDFKERIDQSIVVNSQWVKMYEINLEYSEGRLRTQEYLESILNILSLSLPGIQIEQLESVYLSRVEILLLVQLANAYAELNDVDSTLTILEKIVEYYERSRIEPEYQYHNRSLVMYNMAVLYARKGMFEKSLELCQSVIEMEINCERANLLPDAIMCLAYALKKLEHTPEAKKYYELSIYIGSIFQRFSIVEKSKRMHKKL